MGEEPPKKTRHFTSKQMGDACEMLIAAELTLAGIPALKMPDNWPHYDVIAQPKSGPPLRISVKSRTFKAGSNWVDWRDDSDFDFLAAVILNGSDRAIYIIPRRVADELASRPKAPTDRPWDRYYRIDRMEQIFSTYRDNFTLLDSPTGETPISDL